MDADRDWNRSWSALGPGRDPWDVCLGVRHVRSEPRRRVSQGLTSVGGRREGDLDLTDPIRYTVSMLRANAHYLDVTMELKVPKDLAEVRLAMPVWTPGHYVVADYARNVGKVRAHDQATGAELAVRKVSKSAWVVSTDGADAVVIEYPVYAFTYQVGDSYVDDQHALITGTSVFLYAEGRKEAPARVRLVPREGWKAVSTGMKRTSDWEFEAEDFDVLVDSPLEVGNQRIERFEEGGAEYEVSMYGRPLAGEERFVADIKKVVAAALPIFGHVPYRRYVFIVNFTDSVGGGLEHLNSTVCFLQRSKTVPKEVYHSSMSLFSHEFFHAWNVKRMKPEGLRPFDYSAEMYTKSLWIAEGITSYFDDLIVRRAGIYTVEEYLDALALGINMIKSLPGSRHQSAEEASFDTWIKFYKQDENSPNVTSSYYHQGAVVGWMLDMVLRDSGKGTLDDVMKEVYRDTFLGQGRGYTDAEFEDACVSLGGDRAKEIFDARVRGREEVDFQRFLGYAGLRLEAKERLTAPKGFLGVRLGSDGGKTVVRGCLAGSPAESMGLSANDEVIGLDGMRVSQEKLSFYIGTAEPGKESILTVARNGRLFDVQGKLGDRPTFEWRIQPQAEASDKQRGLFKSWLLADWMPEFKYPEYPRSPDRRVFFDYI